MYAAKRGCIEEWKSPASRCVCHRSRWFSKHNNSCITILEGWRGGLPYLTRRCISSSAGSVPASGFLKQSGIHLDSKGFITVNKVLCKSRDLNGSSFFFHVSYFKLFCFPRWCRQTLKGSLLEGMWWRFHSLSATTRRWTSLTGRWLMCTVSVSKLDLSAEKNLV